jgi:hypothetical protein
MSLKNMARNGAIAATTLMATLAITTTASAQSAIRVGEVVNGTLSASDSVMELDGSNFDCYIVSTRSGTTYTIDMESSDFDTFIGMGAGRGCMPPVYDFNDDRADGDTNSRLTFTSVGGDYFILANSYEAGETGAYRLNVSEGSGAATPARSDSAFSRPTDPNMRYSYDVMCASMGTVGLLLMLERDLSDEEVGVLFEENSILVENAHASGAVLGMTGDQVDDEAVMGAAAMLESADLEADFSPVETRQACLDASGR